MNLQRLPPRAALVDGVSKAVGDARHIVSHPLPALRDQIYGVKKGEAVTVSRFYCLREPPVIVDFEPAPQLGKMHCEMKRRWCHQQGIVYVPVFLREKLTPEAFAARLKDETEAMVAGRQAARDHAATAVPDVTEEAVAQRIETEVLARLVVEEHARGRPYAGGQRTIRLRALCKVVAHELKVKANDGSLGYELRARELAVSAV